MEPVVSGPAQIFRRGSLNGNDILFRTDPVVQPVCGTDPENDSDLVVRTGFPKPEILPECFGERFRLRTFRLKYLSIPVQLQIIPADSGEIMSGCSRTNLLENLKQPKDLDIFSLPKLIKALCIQ